MSLRFTSTDIEGLYIIEPQIFHDERGYFTETYNLKDFEAHGISPNFVQDNQSSSTHGVIRGLHAQRGEHSQGKLVRALIGTVLDVVVDIRPESKTFGKSFSIVLSQDNFKQLYIPRGFLHGFSVMSDEAVLAYKCDNFYCKGAELTVRYDDPDLNIDWQIPGVISIVSDKDRNGISFAELKKQLLQ